MKRLLALLLMLLTLAPAARAHTRDEVRGAYGALSPAGSDPPYAAAPAVKAPYDAGELTQAARREALEYLNFARWLAGVEAVSESSIYDYQCQHGAVLLAALDYVDHNAPRPEDMDIHFYESAHIATTSGCIARFNWMRSTILREGVEYFLRDDGESNLANLGHRRWALNPMMGATGFGLANSESGMSYVVMYAHDLGGNANGWDSVRWPAEGAFPAELIHDHLAWSIVLNPARYRASACRPTLTLREEGSGLSFAFDAAAGEGDGFCAYDLEGYGAGPCIIFRPDFSRTGFTDYQQNQHWTVRVEGLVDAQGQPAVMQYPVDMISLTPQDAVNVEITPLQASLSAGEELRMSAAVVPAYADDLSVTWRSTDPSVAQVDEEGRVTALAPGACEIIAACAGGYEDACALTVR